jgi:hypothetical protein
MSADSATRLQVKKVADTLCEALGDKPVVATGGPATSKLETTDEAWRLFELGSATNAEKLRALHRIVLSTRIGTTATGAVGDTTATIPAALTQAVQSAINELKASKTGIKGTDEAGTGGGAATAKAANIGRLNILMPRGWSDARSNAVWAFLNSLPNQAAVAAAIDKITTGTYSTGMALAGGGRRRKSRKSRKARKARRSRKSRKARSSRKYRSSRRSRRY